MESLRVGRIVGVVLLLVASFLIQEHTANAGKSEFQGAHFKNKETFDSVNWDQVLKKFVRTLDATTQVNYSELKKNPDLLNMYLATIEDVSSDTFSHWSESEQLAFLINAYNALTIKLILDHFPVKSIKDIGGLFSNPWKMNFFKLFGKEHSLDDIEHEMIRKQFNEPRIHFALNCASKGCPALRQEAYVASRLNQQLDEAAVTFLRDKNKNRFDSTHSKLYLSSIFKWYGADFKKKYGSVKAFVAPVLSESSQEKGQILEPQTEIFYLEYDWQLNGT